MGGFRTYNIRESQSQEKKNSTSSPTYAYPSLRYIKPSYTHTHTHASTHTHTYKEIYM